MILKSLVTGAAAAAVAGSAALGVTSIASPTIASADPCAVDRGTLQGVVNTLIDPGGDFAGPKGKLISPPLGFTTGKLANGTLRNLYAKGSLPTDIFVGDPTSCAGNTATSPVSAAGQTMPITFVNEMGTWKVTAASASSVLSALG